MSNTENTMPTDSILYNLTSTEVAKLHAWRASLYEKAADVWEACARNEVWCARAAANNARMMQEKAAATGQMPSGPAPTKDAMAAAALKKASEQRTGAKYERMLSEAVCAERTFKLSATQYLAMVMDPSAQMMPPDLDDAPGAPSGTLNIPKN